MITEEVINSLDLVSHLYPEVPPDKQPEFQQVIENLECNSQVTGKLLNRLAIFANRLSHTYTGQHRSFKSG